MSKYKNSYIYRNYLKWNEYSIIIIMRIVYDMTYNTCKICISISTLNFHNNFIQLTILELFLKFDHYLIIKKLIINMSKKVEFTNLRFYSQIAYLKSYNLILEIFTLLIFRYLYIQHNKQIIPIK